MRRLRKLIAATAVALAFAGSASAAERAELAKQILSSTDIQLATAHVSGKNDDATAKQNIEDTAAGKKAQRSRYDNAPGGSVDLDTRMLEGMLTLSKTYAFSVSEIAGGSHSPNSRHYAGLAFDVVKIDGAVVDKDHPEYKAFMAAAKNLGAEEILGPGVKDHDHHIHLAWPRP